MYITIFFSFFFFIVMYKPRSLFWNWLHIYLCLQVTNKHNKINAIIFWHNCQVASSARIRLWIQKPPNRTWSQGEQLMFTRTNKHNLWMQSSSDTTTKWPVVAIKPLIKQTWSQVWKQWLYTYSVNMPQKLADICIENLLSRWFFLTWTHSNHDISKSNNAQCKKALNSV